MSHCGKESICMNRSGKQLERSNSYETDKSTAGYPGPSLSNQTSSGTLLEKKRAGSRTPTVYLELGTLTVRLKSRTSTIRFKSSTPSI